MRRLNAARGQHEISHRHQLPSGHRAGYSRPYDDAAKSVTFWACQAWAAEQSEDAIEWMTFEDLPRVYKGYIKLEEEESVKKIRAAPVRLRGSVGDTRTQTGQARNQQAQRAVDILSKPFPGSDLLTPRERVDLAQLVSGATSKEAGRALGSAGSFGWRLVRPGTLEALIVTIMLILDQVAVCLGEAIFAGLWVQSR